ncbi:hypothetical protein F5Y16DRAFT_386592 [Xylariaceae sp. FL0255]|nr:hypothetical protein F5Y16DRAFT_386592 [Xylariaceae sp. FL0255]
MSSPTKTIVIFGATGRQGGGVARTFLSLPSWHVRCITRKPTSEKALALSSLGAEMIQADMSIPSTLPPALAGAHAIFLNTDFWETWRPLMAEGKTDPVEVSKTAYEREVENGKNVTDAAEESEPLERFVYSALPSLKSFSGADGKGKESRSYHPEAKAAIVRYIEEEKPALAKKLSLLYAGAYPDNALLAPKLDPRVGKHVAGSPCAPTVKMNVLDPSTATGPFVRCLIEDEEPGVKLLAYNDESYLSLEGFVNVWSEVTGKEAVYMRLPADMMRQMMGISWEHLDALTYTPDNGYDALEGVGLIRPHELKKPPKTQSWADWLREKEGK